MNQRKICYKNRDAYYDCVIKNGDDAKACEDLEAVYRKTCLPSWVMQVFVNEF